jgi:hypothetical protein
MRRTALSPVGPATIATTPAPTSEQLIATSLRGLHRIPVVGRLLLVYTGSRALSLGFFGLLFALAPTLNLPLANFTGSRPGFLVFLTGWDGAYYRQIALHGYPSQVPVDASGHVIGNAWAFLPIYPWLTRGLMLSTGVTYSWAAVLLSLVLGAIATVLLYRLLVDRIGERRALWAGTLFCAGPMTFVFETGYAESLFLALLFASLLFIIQRHYLLAIPFGLVAAFTRPGELALAATIGILFIVQLVRREAISVAERARMIVAGLSLALAGFAWPVIADTVTGDKSAYFDTELSWWTGWIGRVHFVPFTPWFDLFYRYLGIAGVAIVLVFIGAFVFWLLTRSSRVLGDGLLAFTGSYGAYLIAVFLPQQSIARLILPLSPLLGTRLFTSTPRASRITLAVLVAMQPFAILVLWFIYPP